MKKIIIALLVVLTAASCFALNFEAQTEARFVKDTSGSKTLLGLGVKIEERFDPNPFVYGNLSVAKEIDSGFFLISASLGSGFRHSVKSNAEEFGAEIFVEFDKDGNIHWGPGYKMSLLFLKKDKADFVLSWSQDFGIGEKYITGRISVGCRF